DACDGIHEDDGVVNDDAGERDDAKHGGEGERGSGDEEPEEHTHQGERYDKQEVERVAEGIELKDENGEHERRSRHKSEHHLGKGLVHVLALAAYPHRDAFRELDVAHALLEVRGHLEWVRAWCGVCGQGCDARAVLMTDNRIRRFIRYRRYRGEGDRALCALDGEVAYRVYGSVCGLRRIPICGVQVELGAHFYVRS